mgnify:CR=1 FL=1
MSEIVEDAKRYFSVRSEEAFLEHVESKVESEAASSGTTVISIGGRLEFELKSSRSAKASQIVRKSHVEKSPSKSSTSKKDVIDKDLVLETKTLMRDVFLYYTGKRGIVSTLNQSDWNQIMVPRYIKSKRVSNSVYDRVARKKDGLLRFGSFLNAVSIVFRDNVKRVRDEFAVPLLATHSLCTNNKSTIETIPHLTSCLCAIFRSYLNLEERRNVMEGSIKYEQFEDIVSDLQLRYLASSRVIAMSCLESVLENEKDVLMGVPWTRVEEMKVSTGTKRVHVTARTFVSFLIRLSEQLSTEQNMLHQVLYHIYQVLSASSTSVRSKDRIAFRRASMQFRKAFEQYYLFPHKNIPRRREQKDQESKKIVKTLSPKKQISPPRRRYSSIVTGASLIASAEKHLEQSNFEKAAILFLDAAQLHRDCTYTVLEYLEIIDTHSYIQTLIGTLSAMRSLEKHDSKSFVTINEARRHLTASKSAFLRSIEYTRQCHERSKQVKFLRLEIVSLKSVAEMSLISAQISLKYWQSIGGYRALIEIRDAISFSQKCCKKIFAQDVYDIDGFSIYIDSLLLEWKSVLFLWPWYVVFWYWREYHSRMYLQINTP